MLRRHVHWRVASLVALDILATSAALLLSYHVRFHSGLLSEPKPWIPVRYLQALPAAALLSLAVYAVAGRYRTAPGPAIRGAPLRASVAAALAAGAALLIVAGALHYGGEYQYSRAMLLVFPFVAVPLLWAGRRAAGAILGALHRRGFGVGRVLVVGEGRTADELVRRIEDRPEDGLRVAGRVADPDGIPAAIREGGASQVFLAPGADRPGDLERALRLLDQELVDVRIVPDLPLVSGPTPRVGLLAGLPAVTLRETPFSGLNRFAKRACDLAAGAALLLLSLPVMLLTGLAVLLLSGRPVLYGQERMGLDGRTFRILKFRTMRVDAEKETGAIRATRNDPRCTAVGRILRRFSLDELPQLLNVLRGEMSLVGPRPERPVLIERFRERLPGYMLRHRIPAGLTGWAQVNGCRGDARIEARLRYDLDYLESWSLLLDVEILLRTVWHVLRGEHAV